MHPLVTVVDGALPAGLARRLLRAVQALGDRRLAQTYQTTFWHPLGAPPACQVEVAAQQLLHHLPPRLRRGVVGVEWWLSRMRTSLVQVDFHRDRDNSTFARSGRTRHPRVASVLYLNRCRGGLLAVTEEPPCPENPALAPSRHDFDLVQPAPNRYAFFSGSLTHGVLDAENRIPGARLPREPGLRLAVALNFWARRPAGVPRFEPERLAAARWLRGLL